MKDSAFFESISQMPAAKAAAAVRRAGIGVLMLFITVIISSAVVSWLMFTSPVKLPFAIALVLLAIIAFLGGRMHREVHEAKLYLLANNISDDSGRCEDENV